MPVWVRRTPAWRSLPRSVEISQIRWRLIFLDRHQEAVGAQEIVLFPDDNMNVVFGTNILAPPDRLVCRDTTVVLHDRPRTRQRIVDGCDFVVQEVGIGFVEINLGSSGNRVGDFEGS